MILLLVTCRSRAEVGELCTGELALDAELAEAAIDEARRRIQLAAAAELDFELGRAKERLNDLYQEAHRQRDVRSSLAAQRELNKLLGLYRAGTAGDEAAVDASVALSQLAAARSHLAPLVAAGDDEPLDEVARRVVALFTRSKHR